jgi:regulator of sigma D
LCPPWSTKLTKMSTGTGTDPDELTLANVKGGIIKYKTLRKNKLQLPCGTLLDHIEDHEAKVEEAKVEEAKANAKAIGRIDQIITCQRAELEELKEAIFVFHRLQCRAPGGAQEVGVERL